jgi:hypothetical protein
MKLFLTKLKFSNKFSNYTSLFRNSTPIKNFCIKYDDLKEKKEELEMPKKISGILQPQFKKKWSKSSPQNEQFYGLPSSKEKPKSKDDLINKFNYIYSFQDMVEFFQNSENYFTGKELSLFLERLHM